MTTAAPAKARPSVFWRIVSVVGELILTLGFLLLLYVVWELWWTNIEAGQRQRGAVHSWIQEFNGPLQPAGPNTAPGPDPASPAVTADAAYGEVFGVVYIPRFGDDWVRPMAGGTGLDILNGVGLGHYPETTMPGQPGNFALAGHRQTHGQILDDIHTLEPGDKIYVQTQQGYYTYVFRNSEIVLPHDVDVLAPVPMRPEADPVDQVLTLTSCNPRFGSEERIIAYSVLTDWRSVSEGPPAEIAREVAALKGGT